MRKHGGTLLSALAVLFLAGAIPAAHAAEMTVDSLDGPVTKNEIDSFKGWMKTATMARDNNHNGMVYGSAGMGMEAYGAMYEVTGDREILDSMIALAETMLDARNDPKTGKILWTGNRDLVWPNKAGNTPDARGSATENGDVIGHMVYPALLILQHKDLWNEKVTTGDPHNRGLTYLERAKTLIAEGDKTMDTFIIPYLVSKEGKWIFPESELYGTIGDRENKARGKAVPWNQQAMLNNGTMRLAQCHDLLGDAPDRVKKYDTLVKTSVDAFFASLQKKDVDGHVCYQWSYAADDPTLHYIEDSAHGGYDVMCAYQAYASGRYGVTKDMLQPFANTLKYIMFKDGQYAKRTNGNELGKKGLGATWLFLAEIDPETYPILAKGGLPDTKTKPQMTARILWAKNNRAKAQAK